MINCVFDLCFSTNRKCMDYVGILNNLKLNSTVNSGFSVSFLLESIERVAAGCVLRNEYWLGRFS